MKKTLIPCAAILALATSACETGVECGANCPNLSGTYVVELAETPSTCSFTAFEPRRLFQVSQDAEGNAHASVWDPDELESVGINGTISVKEGVDPATSDEASFSGSFQHQRGGQSYNVTLSFTVSGITGLNRRISGSVITSDISAQPCNAIKSFGGKSEL